ncbi:MAG: hypothetical protein ABWX84_02805 [Nocardioides sp.]
MRKYVDRILPIFGIALLVVALIVGAASLKALSGAKDARDQAASTASSSTVPLVNKLDLGATTDEDVASCLTPDFESNPDKVEVLYGVQQRQLGGRSPSLILRNTEGELRLCDHFGADGPSQSPVPTASDVDPVEFLSNGRSAWTCAKTTNVLDRFERTLWLVVAPDVDTVRQRYVVDGVPGPWFESQAQNGYVHLQSWLDGPQPATTKYAEQFQVLDSSGEEVPQTVLPTEESELLGCTPGGSAQIG